MTTRRRWDDFAGPRRRVIHIFESGGPRSGPSGRTWRFGVRGRQGAVRCGVCHAPLRVRGYRSVVIARGTRRVPLYQPCPNLDDPERHPASLQTRKLVGATAGAASPTSAPGAAPFPRGMRLRFVGPGPFAARLAVGTEVVVRSTCGTRSLFEHDGLLFEHDGLTGAIWPEHASQWEAVDSADPAVPRVTSNTSA